MIFSKFSAKGVHGFLDLDIKFNDRLTFLTGINGSGKTSVLNLIHALILPDLSALQTIIFEEVKVDFTLDDGSLTYISSKQTDSEVEIAVSDVGPRFSFARYKPDVGLPVSRQNEAEAEHFRDILAVSSAHPVIAKIEGFATPMFLGLDRRSRRRLHLQDSNLL